MKPDDRFDELFVLYGDRFGLPWKLLKAQVCIESNFDAEAVSPAGAKGLSQFMAPTFAEWAKKLEIENPDPFNPQHAIQCQAAYIDWLIEQTGSGEKALAAYNWGIGNLKKMIEEIEGRGREEGRGENPNTRHPTLDTSRDWREHLPAETKSYIEKVQRQFAEYQEVRNG